MCLPKPSPFDRGNTVEEKQGSDRLTRVTVLTCVFILDAAVTSADPQGDYSYTIYGGVYVVQFRSRAVTAEHESGPICEVHTLSTRA